MRWYEKAMPTVQDVFPAVVNCSEELRKFSGVQSVKVWGSFAENIKNRKYNIKDIDLLIECSFDSGDLLAIDCGENSPLSMSKDSLENEGYNHDAVVFTKECQKLRKLNFDIWAITPDKTLLHWGQIPDTIEEWQDIRKKAEYRASLSTKIQRSNLCKCSEEQRKLWKTTFEQEFHDLIDISEPLGWYASSSNMDDSISIAKSIEI